MRRTFLFVFPALLAACTAPQGVAPSLAPRAAESIDPRLPIPNEVPTGPVSPALASRIAELVAQARSGDAAFVPAVVQAERLAAGAGAPQTESWVAAQQAVSVAQAARGPTTRALGDIDALAANALAQRGGIPAGDLAAVQEAAAAVARIDRAQAERIDALQARLGV